MSVQSAGSDRPGLDRIRAVADAVLYEGYLLYPYRATSSKNQQRWQFGVLGPQAPKLPESVKTRICPCRPCSTLAANESIENSQASLTIHVRFLQLQQRRAERAEDGGGYLPVPELRVDGERWFSWDEAVEVEASRTVPLADLLTGASWSVVAEATENSRAGP